MRTNLPVTQREFPFPEGRALVSTTDLKGRILHCNDVFVAVSGFSREELIGRPHNLIRHPDMPAEAFRDLWATVQAGRPWSGLVKNRRKDGDHYWVMANVTPLLRDGQPAGYLSVRSQPTREQVRAAETLYARMNAEGRPGRSELALHHGRLRAPLWRRLAVGVVSALRVGQRRAALRASRPTCAPRSSGCCRLRRTIAPVGRPISRRRSTRSTSSPTHRTSVRRSP